MTKNHVFAMLAIACIAVLSSCIKQKRETLTLQVKTQYGVLEGLEEDCCPSPRIPTTSEK